MAIELKLSARKIQITNQNPRPEKPAEARDRLVQLMGDVPRIELFARNRFEGWDVWGYEV